MNPRRRTSATTWVLRLFVGLLLLSLLLPLAAEAATDAAPADTATGATPAGAALPAGATKPDIVVLVIDDIALMDNRLWERMPTMRTLFLEHGATFTDASGNDPLCCPGRANLLTGQWTRHHGVVQNHATLFDPRETIATELRSAGYWTGIFGKYFNEVHKLANKFPPGWDQSFIFSGSYWRYTAWKNGQPLKFGLKKAQYSTQQTEKYALKALRFAPVNKPRFIWLAPYGVHVGADQNRVTYQPAQPAPFPTDIGAVACEGLHPWTTPAYTEADLSDKPTAIGNRPAVASFPLTRTCETLLSIDRLLAAVLQRLSEQGRPDPMVVMVADNGMTWGAHHWIGKHVPYATPIPLFIHWPQVLGTAPVTVPNSISNVDLAPTLCEIGGCVMGPYPNGYGVDGISFLSLLTDIGAVNRTASVGEKRRAGKVRRTAAGRITGATLGREVLFEEQASGPYLLPAWKGVRTTNESPIGRWVYTEWASGDVELYDISGGPCWRWKAGDPGDPCQLTNRAGDPEVADIQEALADTLAAQAQAPLRIRGLKR